MNLEKNYHLKERFNFFKKSQPKLPTKLLFLEWFFIFAFSTTTMTVNNFFFTNSKQHYHSSAVWNLFFCDLEFYAMKIII